MTGTSTTGRMSGPHAAGRRDGDTQELPAVGSVTVNGVPQPWRPGLTVQDVVTALLDDGTPAAAGCAGPTGVAAALDEAIVPRGLWASTPVPAGASVEVVTAVQGG